MNGPLRAALVSTLLLTAGGCAELGVLIEPAVAPGGGPLDRETIVAGLREALRVGSERTVERTAAIDGFLANELIRIAIPAELESMARTLRKIGFDRQVDELETAMNRAAEQAAGEAREVLWREIRDLTFEDAVQILRSGRTAATDHFRARAGGEIRRRFRPIVAGKMDQVGLSRLYADLAERYNRLPLVSRPAIDLDEYVTSEAVAGLFTILGEEEARIREDPVARTTELLRRVFART